MRRAGARVTREEAVAILGPEKAALILLETEAPRCPKHPQEPQLRVTKKGPRFGQYLGKCRLCLKETQAKSASAKKGRHGLFLDFGKYPKLYESLKALAQAEIRTPAEQAIYFVKAGLKGGA